MNNFTQYNIPIEDFRIVSDNILHIDSSYWDKKGYLPLDKNDVICVLGKTRNISFKFSSKRWDEDSSNMYFRPREYFEKDLPSAALEYNLMISVNYK